GRVAQLAVEQLLALEGHAAGQAVDGVENRVDLELVGLDFLLAEPAGVGGLVDQALELVEQAADLGQAAFGGGDDVAGALGVAHGGHDAGLLGAEVLAGDEAGGVVGAAVDLQTGREPLEAGVELLVVVAQNALGDERVDVGVDAGHGILPWL